MAIPIYWRNKIYNDEEKERLWLQKLDKGERWINGEKIKASNEKGYIELLEWHRKRNKELGYGDDEINWEQKIYENQLRTIKQLERIKK